MTGSNGNLLSPPPPITTPIITDNGPNHTGNTDSLPGVSNNTGGTQTDNPAGNGTTVGGGYGAGNQPASNPIVMAVPPGDRNAITSGLNGVMGSLPIVTGGQGTNQHSEYPNGTKEDAERVFDNLPLKDVRPIASLWGNWGRTGDLPDGTTVTVRPSRTGPPTIEIVDRNRPGSDKVVQEIRFGGSKP
jgi:hypothetical protein